MAELRHRVQSGTGAANEKPAKDSTVAPAQPEKAKPAYEAVDFLEENSRFIPWVILLISLFTRYYNLSKPTGVVFDEYHFGRFVGQYHAGTYLFDIHPPLGKLVLYYVSKAFGYDHTACSYANIQDQYGPECKYLILRGTAAFFGSITAPLFYWIVKAFGGSTRAGILASILFICDGLNLSESRLILVDSQLIFWCTATLLLALKWWKRWNDHCEACETIFETRTGRSLGWFESMSSTVDTHYYKAEVVKGGKAAANNSEGTVLVYDRKVTGDAFHALKSDARYMNVRERLGWIVAMGVFCCNCVSIKFTGLATPGIIAVESFFAFFFLRRSYPLPDLLAIAMVALVVFVSYYKVHFDLLPNAGDGDGFMPIEFQRNLVGNANYDANAPVQTSRLDTFLALVVELNREMVDASARITQRHHWDSVWYEWPLNIRGVLYYARGVTEKTEQGPVSLSENVYLLGNPLVIWPVLVAMGMAVLTIASWMRFRTWAVPSVRAALEAGGNNPFVSIVFCAIVYVLNLLPYMAVTRSCFIYHYMPALAYGHLIAALSTDRIAGPRGWMPIALKVWAVLAIGGFLIFSPWMYGTPLSHDSHSKRRWLSRWD